MSGTEVVLARLLQGGWPLDPSPGLADPTEPLWKHSRPSVGAHSGQSFSARASREEAANLQIPAQTRRLPFARKVLLMKPVHLITERPIKYFSRCLLGSLWALVKADEASDQG